MFVRICPRHRRQLQRLCFCGRLLHPKSLRALVAAFLGVCVMTSGSAIALNGELISHAVGISHLFVDVTAYFIHGAGTLPIFAYIEPLWHILTGE